MKAGEGGIPPYTATCDKPWYSERQHTQLRAIPGETLPSPSHRLYIRTIKHCPSSQNIHCSSEEARLTVGAVSGWWALMYDFLWAARQPHSLFDCKTEDPALTDWRTTVIKKLSYNPGEKKSYWAVELWETEKKGLYQLWYERVNKSWLISLSLSLSVALTLPVKAIRTFLEFPEFCWREERDERFMLV